MTEQKSISHNEIFSLDYTGQAAHSTSRSTDILSMTAASGDARCIQVRLKLDVGDGKKYQSLRRAT
jgi:hypothetical protein